MVYCNFCVEMGFHFDEIFDEDHVKAWDDFLTQGTERYRPRPNVGYSHHSSYAALVRSVALGCELCKLFLTGMHHWLYHDYRTEDELLEDEDPWGTSNQIFVVGRQRWKKRPGEMTILSVICSRGITLETEVFTYPESLTYAGNPASLYETINSRPHYSHNIREFLATSAITWIHTCFKFHPQCYQTSDAFLPSRVIDVGPKNGSLEPFIWMTPDGSRGSYLALSHCWGGDIPNKTTTKNLRSRQHTLPMGTLPLNFFEAVEVTRILGFQYLWIDSLCILQDSEEDWRIESGKMQSIYKHATITLAATMAPNSSCGFLSDLIPKDMFSLPLACKSKKFKLQATLYFRRIHDISPTLPRGPLTTRAWAVQEKVLSPRTMNFGDSKVFWQCLTKVESDTHMSSDLTVLRDEGLSSLTLHDRGEGLFLWYKIICEYGTRSLTVPEDKLPAISGIAREFAGTTGMLYLAGLWKEDVHRGLIWTYDGKDRDPLPGHYMAPSWSWASRLPLEHTDPFKIPNNIYPSLLFRDTAHHVELVSYTVVPINKDDVYGGLSSASLRLNGNCLPAIQQLDCGCSPIVSSGVVNMDDTLKFEVGSLKNFYASCVGPTNHLGHLTIRSFTNIICFFDNIRQNSCPEKGRYTVPESGDTLPVESQGDSTRVSLAPGSMFIQIGKWLVSWAYSDRVFALLLEPTGKPDEFQRRGLAIVPNDNGKDSKGWKKRTVTII